MLFDRYLFKTLLIATVFVAVVLTSVIFLTQSLRFLELVISSGASGGAFWMLTLLALPRFFEIIVPIALMAATVFVYNKLISDSELVVMRASGMPPLALARPALALAGAVTVFLWITTMWLSPLSSSGMLQMRQVIKAQYSALLFREGVFNAVVPGLTVFVRNRDRMGELRGLMIHDGREKDKEPVTVLAKRGLIVATDQGQQVMVYDGSRQSLNKDTGLLDRLEFERYSIELPDSAGPVQQRWREPGERTFPELLKPDPDGKDDPKTRREFMIEAHRRIVNPLLAPCFTVVALCFLLLGPSDRRGQGWRIAAAVVVTIVLQGLSLAAFNMSAQTNWGLAALYLFTLIPLAAGLVLLSRAGENIHRLLPPKPTESAA